MFQSAVLARLDNPFTSLFRLGIRTLQLVFALASGISYAIELANGYTDPNIIYSQVVFGITLVTLVTDAVTIRTYRLIFVIEFVVCILWLALFGVFYNSYLSDQPIETDHYDTNMGKMRTLVWIDMINFLLWLASAMFSSIMCCSGIKGAIKGRLAYRRAKKNKLDGMAASEKGIVYGRSDASMPGRLPLYEEIVIAARAS